MSKLTLTGGSKVYDGTGTVLPSQLLVSTTSGVIDRSKLLGSVSTSDSNVGDYQSLTGLYSDQNGYMIIYGSGFKFSIRSAASIGTYAPVSLGILGLPLLNPMGPVMRERDGTSTLMSARADVNLQVAGSGVRLPEQAQTLFTDLEYE